MAAPQILQDRLPSINVRHIALCPRMDLIALVLDGDTIAIHRLSWARLATIPPPPASAAGQPARAPISALTWSPTGAALAVASHSGHVRIVRVDPSGGGGWKSRPDGGSDSVELCLRRPVTCLEWLAVREGSVPGYDDRDAKKGVGGQGMVAAGDGDGRLWLHSHDLAFEAAKLQLFPPGTAVSDVHFTAGFAHCFAAGVSGEGGNVSVRHVPLEPLSASLAEVSRTGAEFVTLSSLVAELSAALIVVSKAWVSGAVGDLGKAVAGPLEKLTFDFAEDTSVKPWRVLYNAFCGGGISGALEQFLGKELSESGAKEAHRSFVAAVREAKMALGRALPLAERIVFRASEFRGLARCKSRFKGIGITVDVVDRVFGAGQSVLEGLGDFAEELDRAEKQRVSFLNWLTRVSLQAAGGEAGAEETSVAGDGHGEESDDLTALFFETVLGEDEEGEDESGADMPSVLIGNLVEKQLPSLKSSLAGLASVPESAMGDSLSGATSGSEQDIITLPIAKSCSSAISMTSHQSDDSGSVFTAFLLVDAQDICIIRKNICTADAPFVNARLRIGGPGRGLCSVSFASEGIVCLVTRSAPAAAAGGEKHSFSLRVFSLPKVHYKSCPPSGGASPPSVPQAFDMDGDAVTTVSNFCESAAASQCYLAVEKDRSVVAALIASRRIVLIDLQPSKLV